MAKAEPRRRTKGTGSVFQREDIWYMQYTRTMADGSKHIVRESTATTNKARAERYLKRAVAKAELDRLDPVKDARTVADLYKLVVQDYDIKEKRSAIHVPMRWKHLAPEFGDMLATSVTDQLIIDYITLRKKQRHHRTKQFPRNATINRELCVLKRAFKLGKLPVPAMPKLDESDNVRGGFITAEEAERVIAECAKYGLWMRAVVTVLVEMGFRLGETLKMRVSQFDALDGGRISLPASATKNRRAKFGYLDPNTAKLIEALCANKKPDDLIFTRENGQPVLDFRHAWKTATDRAGVPGRLIHDLRRSAARIMRRAGVDREAVKKLAGWKTDAMFSRYAVDDDDDLRDVARLCQLAKQQRIDSHLSSIADSEKTKTAETRVN